MLDQIGNSEDADLCNRILAVVSAVYRPLTLDELESFVDIPNGVSGDYEALTEIIGLCGSFLTLRERNVSFIHKLATDFLVEKAYSKIYPSGIESAHRTIFLRSLQAISKKIKRDIYGLGSPGFSIDQIKPPDPDPLSSARYYVSIGLTACSIVILPGMRLTISKMVDLFISSFAEATFTGLRLLVSAEVCQKVYIQWRNLKLYSR